MPQCAYMGLPAFKLLRDACKGSTRTKVARQLGVSCSVISQVLNGTGQYGAGNAQPTRLFVKVTDAFGSWPCPHLTEQSADPATPITVTAERCGHLAHRKAPISSPRELAHWQACRACPRAAVTKPQSLAKLAPPRNGRPKPSQPTATPPEAVPTPSNVAKVCP